MELLTPQSKYPFVVFDNVVPDDQMQLVKEEISYVEKFAGIETGATYSNGISKKKNNCVWLTDFYGHPQWSPLITNLQSLYSDKMVEALSNYSDAFIFYKTVVEENKGGILLSKYSEGDYYESHQDDTYYTAVLWLLFEEVEGGGFSFQFDGEDLEVEVKHNRMVLFPSVYNHKVHEVLSGTRYAVSAFFLR